MRTTGDVVYQSAYFVLAAAVAVWVLTALVRRLGRDRPAFAVGRAVAAALVIRVSVAAVMSLFPTLSRLRGPDEVSFVQQARELARLPLFSHPVTTTLTGDLHVWLFSLQFRLGRDPGDLGMRTFHVTLAVAAIALLAGVVYDLAGPRAATLFAWFAAFEPSNVFFSTILHKEDVVMLGEAAFVVGALKAWRELRVGGGLVMLVGALIAGAARNYIGWALLAAGAVVALHAAVRTRRPQPLRQALIVVPLAAATVFALFSYSPSARLQALQASQQANTVTNEQANLPLESVDFGSPGGIARGLPRRVRDVLLRPYPWQTGNLSQRLAVTGTAVAWTLVAVLILVALVTPGELIGSGAPILYPLILMTIAYSLSAGNAGTAFRYRTHLLLLMLALANVAFAASRARIARRRARAPAGPGAAAARA